MTIGVLLYPFGEKKQAGLGAYVLNLTLELITLKKDWHFFLFTKGTHDTQVFNAYPNVTVIPTPNSIFWKDIAYLKHRKDVDVWLYNNPNLPLLVTPKRSLVTALDFGTFYPKPDMSLKARLTQKALHMLQHSALRRTTGVACTSYATKADLHRFFPGIPDQRVEVVMCGYTRVCEVYTADANLKVPPVYYLLVGVIKPRKNQLTAINAFIKAKGEGLEGKLLICGRGRGEYYDTVLRTIKETLYKDDIEYLGYRTNEELVTLYTHARALIFPSHVEGFGMPIMEAMSCGTPVITCSNGALGEAAGGAALTVDSSDVDGFAKAMHQFADEKLRASCIEKGIVRAREFSWEQSAREYAAFLQKLGTLDKE